VGKRTGGHLKEQEAIRQAAMNLLSHALSAEDASTQLIEVMQAARNQGAGSNYVYAIVSIVTGTVLTELQWRNLEYFVIESGLTNSAVCDCLEKALIGTALSLDARISVYSMLRRCGCARLTAFLQSDPELRDNNIEIWMDLLVSSYPETVGALNQARGLLLEAVASGKLGGKYLSERMRLITKLSIGADEGWIPRLLGALPTREAQEVGERLDRLFFGAFVSPESPRDHVKTRMFFASTERGATQFERMAAYA
jgi:hypothetical protein